MEITIQNIWHPRRRDSLHISPLKHREKDSEQGKREYLCLYKCVGTYVCACWNKRVKFPWLQEIKVYFQSSQPLPSHTPHPATANLLDFCPCACSCGCVLPRKVYDYIIQTHRAVRRWTETKENRVLPSKTAVDIVLLISISICCDE